MAIDYGDAHTGIAISDPTGFLAGTTTTINSRKAEVVLEELDKLVKQYQVEELVMGFPKNMDGTEGERAKTVRAFVEILETLVDIPIEFYDERMTTMVAYRYLGATETFGKKRKESIDTLSAEIILQDYLNYEKNKK